MLHVFGFIPSFLERIARESPLRSDYDYRNSYTIGQPLSHVTMLESYIVFLQAIGRQWESDCYGE